MSSYGTDRIPGPTPHGQYSVNHHIYPLLGDKLSHFIWVLKVFYFAVTMKIITWKQDAVDNVCNLDAASEKL